MYMGVMPQGLAPGVKYGQKTDPRSQVLRIGGDLQQSLSHSAKQESVETTLILQGQRSEFVGHGKHHMSVGNGE